MENIGARWCTMCNCVPIIHIVTKSSLMSRMSGLCRAHSLANSSAKQHGNGVMVLLDAWVARRVCGVL